MREGDTAAFSMLSPAGWTTPTFTVFLSPSLPVGWTGGADSFCRDPASRYVVQPLGMLYSLGEPRGTKSAAAQHDSWNDGGNVHGIGDAGEKTMSDPSRYLNNISWLKWNALVRPSGGEFDIFCATCKIKRKCCWLLHCLVKGTGADRNVIKLPAAFICCHSSPCNEYNNNFIYSLAYCSFAYTS